VTTLPYRLYRGPALFGGMIVPAGSSVVLTSIVATNWDSAPVKLHIYSDSVAIVPGVTLGPGEIFTLDTSVYLAPGAYLATDAPNGRTDVYLSGVITDL
jgi:hypothetical protein